MTKSEINNLTEDFRLELVLSPPTALFNKDDLLISMEANGLKATIEATTAVPPLLVLQLQPKAKKQDQEIKVWKALTLLIINILN